MQGMTQPKTENQPPHNDNQGIEKVKLVPAQNPENGHTTKKPTAKLRIASNQITFANPPQDQNKPMIVKTAVPAAGTANP